MTRRQMRPVNFAVGLVLLITLGLAPIAGSYSGASPASAAAPSVKPNAQSPKPTSLVVRVYYRDTAERDRLATELSAEEAVTTGGFITAIITPAIYTNLLARGLRVEIDQAQTNEANDPHLFDTFSSGYKTVEEMQTFLDQEVAAYPNLAEKIDIGDSWCKTHPGACTLPAPYNGYDLWVLHITNRSIPGPKPVFWYDAGIHSREIAVPEVAMRYIDYLLSNYNTNADAHWLVDYQDIWVMPMLNPDGHHIVEAGGGGSNPYQQRKNANNTNGCTTWPPSPSVQFGTDNNRNFPFQWGCCNGSSTAPCDQTYRGASAGSDDETQAVMNKIRALIPDQRGPNLTDPAPITTTGTYQSMHSNAALDLYPWGFTTTAPPNGTDMANIGAHESAVNAGGNGYQACQPPACLYAVDGDTVDWVYGELGIPAMTTEIGGSSFFPAYSQIDSAGGFWPLNKGMLLYLAKIARQPYLTNRGPDTNSPTAAPMTVTVGTTSHLTSTINYNWTGNAYSQNVAAAEYYVDTPPWAGGTAVPMTAIDGSFSSTTEGVEATVPTGSLSVGRHILFVRGRGVNSYSGFQSWGAVSAVFLDVTSGGGNTPTPTSTNTPTRTPTPTNTRTNTPTNTPIPTNTRTNTPTNTLQPTNTPTDTPTNSPTNTPTDTPTDTPTPVTALLQGHVLLQARPTPPHQYWSVPVSLTLRPSGGGPATEYTGMTTDSSGYFTVTVPGPGAYDWRVKNPRALANSGSATLAAGTTTVEMGTLREGDADDNNCVNAIDFSILRGAFGKSLGQPGYDARADFTGDDAVNSTDFTLMRTYYGQCGAAAIGPGPTR